MVLCIESETSGKIGHAELGKKKRQFSESGIQHSNLHFYHFNTSVKDNVSARM